MGEHLRAPVPFPQAPLKGDVFLSATLVIAPEVDPENPGSYTRSGLEVAFRPHAHRKTIYPDGRVSSHAKTKSFFSGVNMYGKAEYIMRDDGHKWEPCLKNSNKYRCTSLLDPCFDVYYHHRQAGQKASTPQPIPYALIISLKAVDVPDLYNRIVRTYSNILVPLRPRIRSRLRT